LNSIQLINPVNNLILDETESGLKDNAGNFIPKDNGVFRFVQSSGYTGNFGFQWKIFKRTQLDKFNGTQFSKDRFFAVTNWEKEDLEGKNVLEAGCGAGRFTQIVLDYTKANLYSFDFSEAVDANMENNGPHPRLKLFQASIYEMPFTDNSFDKIFCLGVLQHTPDIVKSIESLYNKLKPGGEIVIDFYPYNGFWTKLHAKYLFRPFLRGKNNQQLLGLIEKNADWMIALTKLFNRIKIGKLVNRFIPICDIESTHPDNLSKEEQHEWAVLDTFDMFSPEYDQPQKKSDIKKYFIEVGLKDVSCKTIVYNNNLKVTFARGIK
jgi:ubiquinone/menaquinone biosynthesis C-methylase UbiE